MTAASGERSDAALLAAFRDASLPPAELRHVLHVRLAWLYLDEAPALAALARFAADLRAYAAAHGVAGKYHETITWAWLLLVNERRAGGAATWDEFAAANPDLMSSGALARWYRPETLTSPRARIVFMLPDRLA